ncbi:MAG: EVE domain-containing protein [Planctomycetes bacterium]|nr:EVE domain-containing protein [Planctomycetota bacterium]
MPRRASTARTPTARADRQPRGRPGAARAAPGRRYWLFKSEPTSYSFEQLQRDGRTSWNGVRNYQARNLLRSEIAVGDGVLFYHSNAEPMAIVGIARVVRGGYPDDAAFDPASPYHDPDSDPSAPTWYMVDIACVQAFAGPVTREQLKAVPELASMLLLQRGSRLSVQPVTPAEWRAILRLGGASESW